MDVAEAATDAGDIEAARGAHHIGWTTEEGRSTAFAYPHHDVEAQHEKDGTLHRGMGLKLKVV